MQILEESTNGAGKLISRSYDLLHSGSSRTICPGSLIMAIPLTSSVSRAPRAPVALAAMPTLTFSTDYLYDNGVFMSLI